MMAFELIIFAAAWVIGLYLLNSLLARQFIKLSLKPLLFYVSNLAMLGVYGETIFGNVYHYVFGHSLWRYTVLPIHHGYTSQYALVLWGAYGFHLYLMHDTVVKRHAKATRYLPYIFCLEAIVIEAAVNITFRLSFGHYLFYFLPSDLWHLTSVQTLPVYFAGGFIFSMMLVKGRRDPLFFAGGAAAYATVLIILT